MRAVPAAPAAALGAPPPQIAQDASWNYGARRAPLPQDEAIADQRWECDSIGDPDNYMVNSRYHPSLQPRPVKSGLVAKSTDQVRFPQTWPHVALQDEFFQQSLEFKDLDFRLFVAGELEIATSPDISERERTGRLLLLKQLAYLNGAHQWDIIRNIYLSVVRKIELGSLNWGSSFLPEIQWILTKHTATQPARSAQRLPRNVGQAAPKAEGTLYCFDFNKGACSFRDSHYINFKGRQEWVKHVCSKCWRRDAVCREHPKTECTH